ncbi:MAG TPA: VOC family protein [Anaerolineaceae bacterium]|nr:VOC family protein [Anaerolineaceae bacterium]
MSAIPLSIDHTTLAARDLDLLVESFRRLGLNPVYGGAHSNGVTHMAVLGFPDGSYIELISTLRPGQNSPWWDQAIRTSAGPCAWAIQAKGIDEEARRLAGLGIPVRGPLMLSRLRPDGVRIEWELAFPDEKEPGSTLPFLIEDITPRELRVQPAPAVAQAGLIGIRKVVLGVGSLSAAARRFEELYGWPQPEIEEQPGFGARLASFAGQPVILAEPIDLDGWLAQRLDRLGETPCAFVLACRKLTEVSPNLGLSNPTVWFGTLLAWLPLSGDLRVAVQQMSAHAERGRQEKEAL